MITRGKNKTIINIIHGREIQSVYKGLRLIWTKIRSCFGSGYWVNTLPWRNEDVWKN